MTYLWGENIQVLTNALGLPHSFIWHNQRHGITQIAAYYRMDTYWWQRRIWRDVFTVLTQTHLAAMIYRDLTTNDWYLLRLYD